MSYHLNVIPKGELGHLSKIREEYLEFLDAYDQGSPILELVELSDLLGAIEAYTLNHYDIELGDIVKMTEATKRAFESGHRKSQSNVSIDELSISKKYDDDHDAIGDLIEQYPIPRVPPSRPA